MCKHAFKWDEITNIIGLKSDPPHIYSLYNLVLPIFCLSLSLNCVKSIIHKRDTKSYRIRADMLCYMLRKT